MIRTLIDFLPWIRDLGSREALRFHNGFRTWTLSYSEFYDRIAAFAGFLANQQLGKGDRLLLWAESRPEWAIVFWSAISNGIELVPVDPQSSRSLIDRIVEQTRPKIGIFGQTVDSRGLPMECLQLEEVPNTGTPSELRPVELTPEDVVEVVFTSGTTGEPKGVVHRHRNLCANLRPFAQEIFRYRKLARPFQPIRILDLLPLSHMFGQSLGLFIPVLLQGAAVFTTELTPGALQKTIHRERISVLVAVPRIILQLQDYLEHQYEISRRPPKFKGWAGILERWWRYRQIHSDFGWKFWSVLAGGAEVSSEIEDFWSRLGILLIQGYGLTEASPIISVNHPFRSKRGSVGKVLEGQEVKIAPDGEILVRGDSIVQEYLEGDPAGGRWLHTGDIGEIDEEGRLYFKGRKKDVIVTGEGLNIHPQDIEEVLSGFPEIRESTVVGIRGDGGEEVHAVLILKVPGQGAEDLIRQANHRLEAHQRIRSWSIWPNQDFPRTASTLKIKRSEVAQQVQSSRSRSIEGGDRPSDPLQSLLTEISGKTTIRDQDRISEDLGLSSLDRVELLARLQTRFGIQLDEETFSGISTVEALRLHLNLQEDAPGTHVAEGAEPGLPKKAEKPFSPTKSIQPPRWTRIFPVRVFRIGAQLTVIVPLFRHFLPLTVEGLNKLEPESPPLLFAANHTSHLDTLAVLTALPLSWRSRLAPAMLQERFLKYFRPETSSRWQWFKTALQYFLACSLVNAYPLPQRMGGIRRFLRYTGEMVEEGYCPLIFPEGRRTPDGELLTFQDGIGMLADKLQVPVVPVHIEGLYQVLSLRDSWPKPGPVTVRFGSPIQLADARDYSQAAARVAEAVKKLSRRSG